MTETRNDEITDKMKTVYPKYNDFMINLHESYVAELGFKHAIPGSAVRCVTNWAMKFGSEVL